MNEPSGASRGPLHESGPTSRGPAFTCHFYGLTWAFPTVDDRDYFLRAHLIDCEGVVRSDRQAVSASVQAVCWDHNTCDRPDTCACTCHAATGNGGR